MKITKNFVRIISILALLLVLLFVLSKLKDNLSTNALEENSNNKSVSNVLKIPNIMYINKNINEGKDEVGKDIITKIYIPQIANASSSDVFVKINRDIIDNYNRDICDDGGDFVWTATTTILNTRIISFVVTGGSFCSWAMSHNNFNYGLNYNLNNWDDRDYGAGKIQIKFADIFKDYDHHKNDILNIVIDNVNKNYDLDYQGKCIKEIKTNINQERSNSKFTADDIDFGSPFGYAIGKDGLYITSFRLAESSDACEPYGREFLLPYETLKPYLKTSFLEMVK